MLKPPEPGLDEERYARDAARYVEEIQQANPRQLMTLLQGGGGESAYPVANYARHFTPKLVGYLVQRSYRAATALAANPFLDEASAVPLLEGASGREAVTFLGISRIFLRRGDLWFSSEVVRRIRQRLEREKELSERQMRFVPPEEMDAFEEADYLSAGDPATYCQELVRAYRERDVQEPPGNPARVDDPTERDWAGRQLVAHPLSTVEQVLQLFDEYDNPYLARQVVERRRGYRLPGETSMLQDARIRARLLPHLEAEGVALALALLPQPADFAAAMRVAVEKASGEMARVLDNRALPAGMLSGLDTETRARLMGHPEQRVRLAMISAMGHVPAVSAPVSPSASQHTPSR